MTRSGLTPARRASACAMPGLPGASPGAPTHGTESTLDTSYIATHATECEMSVPLASVTKNRHANGTP